MQTAATPLDHMNAIVSRDLLEMEKIARVNSEFFNVGGGGYPTKTLVGLSFLQTCFLHWENLLFLQSRVDHSHGLQSSTR